MSSESLIWAQWTYRNDGMVCIVQGGNGGWEGAKQAADEPAEPVEDPEVATARLLNEASYCW